MALKTKKRAPSDILKKGVKTKNRRNAQLPPQLHSSESEELGLDDEEPSLHDVVKMLEDITTGQAKTNARVDSLTAHMVTPGAKSDAQPGPSHATSEGRQPLVATVDEHHQFHVMEEQVHRRICQCIKAEGDQELHIQPRKTHKGTSGKLRTADITVITQIVWPMNSYIPVQRNQLFMRI